MKNLTVGLQNGLRQSIAGGVGVGDIFSTASLDLNFAKHKNLGTIVDATTGANLVDFTRASSATYVGSDGLIKTATTNLLLRSEEFDNASWINSASLVTANTAVAPNGTLTADTLTPDVLYLYAFFSNSIATYTSSVFVKSAGATSCTLLLEGSLAGLNGGVTFSFTSNTESSTGTVDSVSSQPFGNGWYRITATLTATGSATPQFRLATSGGDVYIWGAQLEQSSTVGEYVKTTSTINSAPRFDHDPTTGESLGLLVEELRVNSFEWSNSATDGETWNNVDSYLSLASGQSDPAGGTAGIRATDADSASGGTFLQRTSLANLTASTTVTYSIWLKPIDCPNNVLILNIFANTTTDSINATFSVSGTDITAVSTSANGTGAASGASFEAFPNGWYRCRLTGVPSTVTMADVRARINLGSYQRAAGTARFDWYGAQFESGAFATSYIPTTGATATRAADVASISGSNFSGWYRQDEGTVFAEFRDSPSTRSEYPFAISDNTVSNRFTFFTSGSSSLNSRLVSAGSAFNPSNVSFIASSLIRASMAGKTGADQAITACNGVLSNAGSPTSMPAVNLMYIGAAHNGLEQTNGTIRRLTYWPQRLPNEILQTITQ